MGIQCFVETKPQKLGHMEGGFLSGFRWVPEWDQVGSTDSLDMSYHIPSKPNLHPENLNQVFVLLHAPLPPNFNVESTY